MNEIAVFLIALAIASAQTDQVRLIELRRPARAEPIRLIGKPLTPMHPIPILPGAPAY